MKYRFKMIHLFHLRNINSGIYLLLLTCIILMESGVANDRRGQEMGGSLQCDSTIIVNFTCTTEVIPIQNTRNAMQNDSIFERQAENKDLNVQLETNGQNDTGNVLNSSTLKEIKNCDFNDVKQSRQLIVKCNDFS